MKIIRKNKILKKFEFVKIILIGIFALAVLSFSVIAQASIKISDNADIRVSFVNQEPDPVEPGRYFDFRIKFENNGSEQAKDIVVELLPEYPFSLDPGKSAIERLGSLHARQLGDTAVIVKYKIRVDENAVEGENKLKIRYKIDKGSWIEPDEFLVDVQTHDAILSVDSVTIGEKALEPGSSSPLNIKLSNKADSVLEDIQIKLVLGNLPFVPLESTNEKSIYQIGSKQDYEFSFELLVDPEAESGVYKVPMEIVYSDELGKGYSKNSTIGIVIGATPDLSFTLDDSGIYQAAKSGEIVVKVVNKGVIGVKFMNIKLLESDRFRILSNDEAYLGNIDSDDFETADYNVFIKSTKEKSVGIPIEVEYKDANNNDYKKTINLDLNLYSGSEAKKFGFKQGNKFTGILIVLIIVGAGIYFYRKKRKKKK